MLSRKTILQSVPLTIVSFLGICSAFSCIRFETYQITEYKMTPFDSRGDWFGHSFHYSPRRVTRAGLRSRRIFGCCEQGYQYTFSQGFRCQPICSNPCPANSHCSAPGVCSCDDEYHSSGLECVSNQGMTKEYIPTTTAEPPCNGSCGTNEKCSASVNVCICRDGFQRSSGFAGALCVRKCTPQCPKNSQCSESGECICNAGYHNVSSSECVPNQTTTEEYIQTTTVENKSVEPPCNDSCTTNEECSTSDNICLCKDGFERPVGKAVTNCVPKCEPKCQQADCTAPNTCECWPHYEQANSSFCHMKCSEQSCVYGKCDEQGTCVCAEGFLNNGTACVWAGDAILSEPDVCDCWSKFTWERNKTESGGQQCLPLCGGDDSIEVASECINFTHCQCFEAFLVCPAQIYKCSVMLGNESIVNTGQQLAKKITNPDDESSNQLTILIVSFLGVVLIIGAILWIWQKRHGTFNRLFNYGRMASLQDDDQT